MSTIQNNQLWNTSQNELQSKYEKCRNITEEIYKRINITFEIKKLETGEQSDVSVDSADLDSCDTDLFACDKTDSLPSSTEAEPAAPKACLTKYININNNEEKKVPVYKRPKKKFRKRVKKRVSGSRLDREGSSDEEVLPARAVGTASPERCTVPNIIIVTKGLTPKILNPDKKTKKNLKLKLCKESTVSNDFPSKTVKGNAEESTTAIKSTIDNKETIVKREGEKRVQAEMDSKSCSLCGQIFKNERGLRRHIAMSHITEQGSTRPEREVKPA